MYIDLHCHLDAIEDIDGAISRAHDAGVSIIVSAGVDSLTNKKTLELARRFSQVRAALGFYPMDALSRETDGTHGKDDIENEILFIEKNKDKIIAIGEVGLDYFNGKDKETQKLHFKKIIELAERIKKPLIVHSRKAEEDVIEMLSKTHAKVVLHCFSGRKNLVKRAIELGYFFSIPTNVVRAQHFWGIIEAAPINRLFCETDSPWLSPYPGKKNEPAFVVESYKKIAEIKGLDLVETERLIFQNYQQVFM
jgi:TatD DNase family protein